MKSITHQTLNLPREAPLMVLPNAVLFPHALLPLYMFEEQYRKMVAHCLERERMFCIALLKPGHTEARTDDDFFHVCGLGLIRACVENADGTSHLVLQGLARVNLLHVIADSPFRIAQIRQLKSELPVQVEADALAVKVTELCQALKEKGAEVPPALAKQLPLLTDPDVLSDIVSHTFVGDPYERQLLLTKISVPDRLRFLIACLRRELEK